MDQRSNRMQHSMSGSTMSRKHNTKHNRKRSNYPLRLKKRGVSSASVRMDDLETLRKRASRQQED